MTEEKNEEKIEEKVEEQKVAVEEKEEVQEVVGVKPDETDVEKIKILDFVENKLEQFEIKSFKNLSLDTALLLGIFRALKTEVTDEIVVEEAEVDPLDEPRMELKVKRMQLKNHNARLNGGVVRIGDQALEVPAVDKEIALLQRKVEMTEIEHKLFIPITPYYRFESDERWRELKRQEISDSNTELTEKLAKVQEQKDRIDTELPELKVRINEIEKELGEDITKFSE